MNRMKGMDSEEVKQAEARSWKTFCAKESKYDWTLQAGRQRNFILKNWYKQIQVLERALYGSAVEEQKAQDYRQKEQGRKNINKALRP